MRIYSHNVNRKYVYVSTLLEELWDLYDILFLQEPSWQTVRYSASMKSKKGKPVKGPPLHPHWIPIVPKVVDAHIGCLCIMAYVHRILQVLKPKNRTDIMNHPDVLLTFKGPLGPLNVSNVYSDPATHGRIQLLQDCVSSLPEIRYMGGNFNCCSCLWDDMLTYTSGHAEKLFATAIELGLEVQLGNVRTPTHFSYYGGRSSVIDLVFLRAGPTRATVRVDNRGPSDHCFVSTVIPFGFSLKPGPKQTKPGSDEESEFLGLVSDRLSSLSIPTDDGEVSVVVSHVVDAVASAWSLVAKASRVCMCLKSWWLEDCTHAKCIALKVNTKNNWITLNKATEMR